MLARAMNTEAGVPPGVFSELLFTQDAGVRVEESVSVEVNALIWIPSCIHEGI